MGRSSRGGHGRSAAAAAAVWLVLAAVLLALPVYGWSSATLKLLGPAHRHTAAAAHHEVASDRHDAAGDLLAALLGRRIATAVVAWQQHIEVLAALPGQAVVLRSSHADHRHALQAGEHAGKHAHGLFQRHHHSAADATVVKAAADSHGADAADEAGAGSATLPLLAGFRLSLPRPAARRRAWPRPQPCTWRDGLRHRLDRPPSGH